MKRLILGNRMKEYTVKDNLLVDLWIIFDLFSDDRRFLSGLESIERMCEISLVVLADKHDFMMSVFE